MALIFKSRINILNTIISSLDLLLLIISGSFLIYKGNLESIWISLFGFFLLFIGTLQFITYVKFFHLSEEELKIRFPLKFFSRIHSFKLSDIREVNFAKGLRSPFITIRKNGSYEEDTFGLNFYDSDIEKLIAELNKLGIKTTRKNI